MDELILKWLRGRATPEELHALERWRRADPANERHAREFERVWSIAGEIEPLPVEFRPPSTPQRSLGPRAAGYARRRGYLPAAGGVLATGAIAASLAAVAVFLAQDRWVERTLPPATVAEFTTGANEMVTIQLTDGTAVRLAPRSRLRFVTESNRQTELWLEGRAFFGVRPREERTPFVVRTPLGDAHVVGTRFDLDARGETLDLVVFDGLVALSTPSGSVEVEAGHASRVRHGESPILETVEDVEAVTKWMGRSLIFQSNPLSQVAREIEGRHGARIDIQDPYLSRETVTATFTDESFDEVMRVLCQLLDARCIVDERSAVIRTP